MHQGRHEQHESRIWLYALAACLWLLIVVTFTRPGRHEVSASEGLDWIAASKLGSRALVRHAAPRIAGDKSAAQCSCRNALERAIITAPEVRDRAMMERLAVVAGRVLKKEKPA